MNLKFNRGGTFIFPNKFVDLPKTRRVWAKRGVCAYIYISSFVSVANIAFDLESSVFLTHLQTQRNRFVCQTDCGAIGVAVGSQGTILLWAKVAQGAAVWVPFGSWAIHTSSHLRDQGVSSQRMLHHMMDVLRHCLVSCLSRTLFHTIIYIYII